jgi:phosphoserine aminotransferase
VYAWPHHETSTGVVSDVFRPASAREDQLVVVDGTSAAGSIPFNPTDVDVYYFSPQKGFAADGGLWIAFLSPKAVERAQKLATTERWIPEVLSLSIAVENSAKNQTLNTPAISTLVLIGAALDWLTANGGLSWAYERVRESSSILYTWAERTRVASPFVAKNQGRSPVVGTIDFADQVDAKLLSAVLRANGIVDTEPYRSLGRNQLRIGMFPAVDPADVASLTACIDYVIEYAA